MTPIGNISQIMIFWSDSRSCQRTGCLTKANPSLYIVIFAYKDCARDREEVRSNSRIDFILKYLNFALPNYTQQSYHPIFVFHEKQLLLELDQ